MNTQINSVVIGSKIIANNMNMVVTKITDVRFFGYYEYKGKKIELSMCKDMFSNPHYMNNITVQN